VLVDQVLAGQGVVPEQECEFDPHAARRTGLLGPTQRCSERRLHCNRLWSALRRHASKAPLGALTVVFASFRHWRWPRRAESLS
jgi:hypothetical protein